MHVFSSNKLKFFVLCQRKWENKLRKWESYIILFSNLSLLTPYFLPPQTIVTTTIQTFSSLHLNVGGCQVYVYMKSFILFCPWSWRCCLKWRLTRRCSLCPCQVFWSVDIYSKVWYTHDFTMWHVWPCGRSKRPHNLSIDISIFYYFKQQKHTIFLHIKYAFFVTYNMIIIFFILYLIYFLTWCSIGGEKILYICILWFNKLQAKITISR